MASCWRVFTVFAAWFDDKVKFLEPFRHTSEMMVILSLHIPTDRPDRMEEIKPLKLPLESRFTFKLLPVVDRADIYEMLCQSVSAGIQVFSKEPCVKHYSQSKSA